MRNCKDIRMKREPEALRDRSQQKHQPMNRMVSESSSGQNPTTSINPRWDPPPTPHLPAQVSPVDPLTRLLPSLASPRPADLQPCSAHTGQPSRGQSSALGQGSRSAGTETLAQADPAHGAMLRPAIAALAGTTRCVSLCPRPQPPARPWSRRPSPACRTARAPTPCSRQKCAKLLPRRPSPSASLALHSTSTDDASDSDSSQSDGNTRKTVRRKRSRKGKEAQQRQRVSSVRGHMGSGERSAGSEGSGVAAVRSATELLEEARAIVGTDAHTPQHSGQQRAPEEPPEAAEMSVREWGHKARGVLLMATNVRSSPQAASAPPPSSAPPSAIYKTDLSVRPTQPGPPLADDRSTHVVPAEVRAADLLVAHGGAVRRWDRSERAPPQKDPPNTPKLALLATWAPKSQQGQYKTIHHLCTLPASHTLPMGLQQASRLCHAAMPYLNQQRAALQLASTRCHMAAEHDATPQSHHQRAAVRHRDAQPHAHRLGREGPGPGAETDPEPTDGVCDLPPPTGGTCVLPPPTGGACDLPPLTGGACDLPPPTGGACECMEELEDWERVAECLAEKPRMVLQGQRAPVSHPALRVLWQPAPPKFCCTPAFVKETLCPQYQAAGCDVSSENFQDDLQNVKVSAWDMMASEPSSTMEGTVHRRATSLTDLRPDATPALGWPPRGLVRRTRSAPHLTPDPYPPLHLQSDFPAVMRELELVRWQQQHQTPSLPPPQERPLTLLGTPQEDTGLGARSSPEPWGRSGEGRRGHSRRSTGASHPRRKIHFGGGALSAAKMATILQKLQEPPRTLSRSESVGRLTEEVGAYGHVPPPRRYSSLPQLLDFSGYSTARGGVPLTMTPREWVWQIWDGWFDELFLPLDASGAQTADAPCCAPVEQQDVPRDAPSDTVHLSQTLEDGLSPAQLEAEVGRLTHLLAQQGNDCAFHLCRRGALYRRLGRAGQALEDLNAAVSLEPMLLDARWHRHCIHLLRNELSRALEDLNIILKHNSNNADAFRSRAEIYRTRGESALAILDYTQAVRCKPTDHESHFRRAQMHEERNEILPAMEDYAKTFAVNPERTDALMRHRQLCFLVRNWRSALTDVSTLLQVEPRHGAARMYRGWILMKLGRYPEAIEEFSLALHLDPNDWQAFYYRGCLLRQTMPEKALQDLSTSVLISHGRENLQAFLHRGLLYAQLAQWHQALADFEAVINLDSGLALAHVNLGLIYMLKLGQNFQALRMFTNALKADPTHIRAYSCRAHAYRSMNDLRRALKDLTSAIHMKPNVQHLQIMRGQCLCAMGRYELAMRCLRHTAETDSALGSSVIQRATVQSFLGNDAEAITCLQAASRTLRHRHIHTPDHTLTHTQHAASILSILGKIQMKAHRFTEALESFQKALAVLSTAEGDCSHASEAAELHYLMGRTYMSQSLLQQALGAFSSAVQLNPDHADAYHQRGLCRIQLQQPNAVQDLNRALFINPNLYQVFLSRAVYFGALGRYSKALLNCNAAIRIQPRSVRAYLSRGAVRFHHQAYHAAVEDLTVAVALDSTCSVALFNRAVCYQHLKEHDLALRDYDAVLQLPSLTDIEHKVLINRGLLYVELRDHHNALQDFKAAAVNRPGDANIHHSLGVYQHRLGRLQEAMQSYSAALCLRPLLPDSYVGRGNVLMDYGHQPGLHRAQRDYLCALHLDPLCTSARVCLAYSLQALGRFQRAWDQFTVAMEINPRCWAAREGRGVVNVQMGNMDAAYQDISNALKLSPGSARLHTNGGLVCQLRGDRAGAMQHYQRAIAMVPSSSLANFNAGNLLFYNRQFQQACEYYDRACELDPSDDCAGLNRAITLALLRKAPAALREFERVLRLNPDSAHAHFNRANLYCSLRRYREAEMDLTHALRLLPGDALLYKQRADVRCRLGWTTLAMRDHRMAVELEGGTEI